MRGIADSVSWEDGEGCAWFGHARVEPGTLRADSELKRVLVARLVPETMKHAAKMVKPELACQIQYVRS